VIPTIRGIADAAMAPNTNKRSSTAFFIYRPGFTKIFTVYSQEKTVDVNIDSINRFSFFLSCIQ